MLKDANCIVFKVGTSTIMYPTKKTNIRVIDFLAQVLCDLANSGKRVVLVTSGAIGVGVEKLGLEKRPRDTAGKQAAATVGQCALMYLYDKMFAQYGRSVGQLLMTKDDVDHANRRQNLINAFQRLFDFGVIPIVNENDSVSSAELETGQHKVLGDNDTLSAIVARLCHADLLVLLIDIDGLYDSDPRANPEAHLIHRVTALTEEIRRMAGGAGSWRGTGGMATKLSAAGIVMAAGCDMVITNGARMEELYGIVEGRNIGTRFVAR